MGPLQSIYDHPFYINHIYPQGIIYNLCPKSSRGVSSLETEFVELIITLNKMAVSKFSLDVFRKILGAEGRIVALQSQSTIKKSISPFNFQSKGPLLKFLRQLLRCKVPWFKTKNNNNK